MEWVVNRRGLFGCMYFDSEKKTTSSGYYFGMESKDEFKLGVGMVAVQERISTDIEEMKRKRKVF